MRARIARGSEDAATSNLATLLDPCSAIADFKPCRRTTQAQRRPPRDPANRFHEKAILCRAAENTCYVATVNCAIPGSPTTSAVARPDGTLLCYQPYGKEGILTADID